MRGFLAAGSLAWREWLRLGREKGRVAGVVATPLVFWLLIGSGLRGSFAHGEMTYLQYFFPGTAAMIVLFGSIFATFTLIEDRKEGFLQGVLVSPVPRWSLVAGKVAGGGGVAALQGILFLALAPPAHVTARLPALLAGAGVLVLLGVVLTALGFVFAWRTESSGAFHAVMNLVLMPMWLLSGALFPLAGAPPWLQWVMRVNPLTYGVAALRRALMPGEAEASLPSMALSLGVTAAFGAAMVALASVSARRSAFRGVA